MASSKLLQFEAWESATCTSMVPLLNAGQRSPLQIDAFSLRCGELAAPTNFQTEVGVLEQGMCLVQQVVLNNVNQDTFGDYLDVASSRRLQRLEAKCIDYLLANFEKVGRPFLWVQLDYIRICHIVQLYPGQRRVHVKRCMRPPQLFAVTCLYGKPAKLQECMQQAISCCGNRATAVI
jgi:hypothetical protein